MFILKYEAVAVFHTLYALNGEQKANFLKLPITSLAKKYVTQADPNGWIWQKNFGLVLRKAGKFRMNGSITHQTPAPFPGLSWGDLLKLCWDMCSHLVLCLHMMFLHLFGCGSSHKHKNGGKIEINWTWSSGSARSSKARSDISLWMFMTRVLKSKTNRKNSKKRNKK
jgi:hypothetical protein